MSILSLIRNRLRKIRAKKKAGSTKPVFEEPKNLRRHRIAYHAKAQLVKAGKGHNTLSGIPAHLLS